MDYGKKFLIIGNNNAVTYKEIFPYIKSGELRLGHSSNKTFEFKVPDGYSFNREENGVKYGKVPAISWFTNLKTHKADNPMELVEKYDPVKFPKYDNYDAINVDKVVDIPYDYDGVMGVPITIVDKVADDGFIHCTYTGVNEVSKNFNYEIVHCMEPAIDLVKLKKLPNFVEYKSRQIKINDILCQKSYHRIMIKKT